MLQQVKSFVPFRGNHSVFIGRIPMMIIGQVFPPAIRQFEASEGWKVSPTRLNDYEERAAHWWKPANHEGAKGTRVSIVSG